MSGNAPTSAETCINISAQSHVPRSRRRIRELLQESHQESRQEAERETIRIGQPRHSHRQKRCPPQQVYHHSDDVGRSPTALSNKDEHSGNSPLPINASESDIDQLVPCGVELQLMELDLCIPDCLVGFTKMDPMIPCGLCDRWFHIQCLGLPTGGPRCIRGLYFCQGCLQDFKQMRLLLRPQREREARLEAVEALVKALDVENALLREQMSRTNRGYNLDELVATLGDRMVDASYAALLRESARIKREMADVIATNELDRRQREIKVEAAKRIATVEAFARKREEAQTRADIKSKEQHTRDAPPSVTCGPLTQSWSAKVTNRCAVCNSPYKSLDNLRSHLLRVHGLGIALRCAACSWQSSNFYSMLTHQKKRHSRRVGIARVLVPANAVNKQVGVDVTSVATNGSPKAKRVITGKNGDSSIPTNVADPNRPFRCPHRRCDQAYVNIRNLTTHLRIRHRDRKRSIVVEAPKTSGALSLVSTVGNFSKSLQTVALPGQISSQLKDHFCHVCDSMFARFDHLKRHLRLSHKLVVFYSCANCQWQSTVYGYLRAHLNEPQGCRGKYRRMIRSIDTPAHAAALTPFKCGVCNSRHETTLDLHEHLLHNHPTTTTTETGALQSPPKGNSDLQALLTDSTDGKVGRIKIFRGDGKQMRSNPTSLRVRQNAIGKRARLILAQAMGKRRSCHLCTYSTTTYGNLKRHLLSIHQLEIVYKCCENLFSSYADIRNHQTKSHEGCVKFSRVYRPASMETVTAVLRPHKCKVCFSTFQCRSRLNVHLRSHRPSKTALTSDNVKPPDSSSLAPDKGEVEHRDRAVLDPKGSSKTGKRYGCHICNSLYESSRAVKNHLLRMHRVEVFYMCNLCKQEFSKYRQLCSHQNETHGDNNGGHSKILRNKSAGAADQIAFGQTALQQSGLFVRKVGAKSAANHSSTPRLVCHVCKVALSRYDYLREHLLRLHQVLVVYSCKICRKQLPNYTLLRAHQVETHDGRSGHTRSFKNVTTQTRDTILKPNRCHMCHERFATSSDLNRHLFRSHGIATSYECSECHQTFTSASDLKVHQADALHVGTTKRLSSSGETSGSQLARSSPSVSKDPHATPPQSSDHIIDFKYECHVCLHKFKAACNLKSHLKALHGIEFSYQCKVCLAHFTTNAELLGHQSTSLHKGSNKVFHPVGKYAQKPGQLTICKPNGPAVANRKQFVYECCLCTRIFSRSDYYKRHLTTEHSISDVDSFPMKRILKLGAPKKKFNQIGVLLTSGRVQCNHCPVNHPSRGRLLNHMEAAHPLQYASLVCPFACTFCGKKFERLKSMKNHIACKHRQPRNSDNSVPTLDLSSHFSNVEHENSWVTLQGHTDNNWNVANDPELDQFQFRVAEADDALAACTSTSPVQIALSIVDPSHHQEWNEAAIASGDTDFCDKAIVHNPEEEGQNTGEAAQENWAPIFLLDTEIKVEPLSS